MINPPAYPLFVTLARFPVLIVGGGKVALRKARGVIESAAHVTVISPAFDAGFDPLAITRICSAYAATHITLKRWRLVFAATNSREVNAQVQRDARDAGIFCCRCDDPEEGDFSGGAVQRLGASATGQGMIVAVSTFGASPALSARVCHQAAAAVDPVLLSLANLLASWRIEVKSIIADASMRRRLLQRLAGEEMEAVLRKGGEASAAEVFRRWLAEARAGTLPAMSAARNREAVDHGD